jgi:hypothetical protein
MTRKFAYLALAGVIAFLMATNSVVADAAKLITGKQIKNGSITTKDIKNNNLKSADVKNNNLRSADVKDGSLTSSDLKSASAYLDRVAFGTRPNFVPLPAAAVVTEVVAPVSITVPQGVSLVHIIGTSSLRGDATGSMWTQQDGVCAASGAAFSNRAFVDAGIGEAPATFNYVTAITPGTHTFRLCARNSVAGGARGSTLSVETVATGNNGGTTLKQARPGANRSSDSDD